MMVWVYYASALLIFLQESVYGNNTMRRKSKKRKRSSRAKNVVMTDIRGNDLVVSENGGDNLEMMDSL